MRRIVEENDCYAKALLEFNKPVACLARPLPREPFYIFEYTMFCRTGNSTSVPCGLCADLRRYVHTDTHLLNRNKQKGLAHSHRVPFVLITFTRAMRMCRDEGILLAPVFPGIGRF